MSFSVNTLETRNNFVNEYLRIVREHAYMHATALSQCLKEVGSKQASLPYDALRFDLLVELVSRVRTHNFRYHDLIAANASEEQLTQLGYKCDLSASCYVKVFSIVVASLMLFLSKQARQFDAAYDALDDFQRASLKNAFKELDVQDGYSWLVWTILDNIDYFQQQAYEYQLDAIEYWHSRRDERARLRKAVKKMIAELQ